MGYVVLNLAINFFKPIISTFTTETEYIPGNASFSSIFEQADRLMYENKKELKNG